MKLSQALGLVPSDGGNILYLPLAEKGVRVQAARHGLSLRGVLLCLLFLSGLFVYKAVTGEQAIDDTAAHVKVKR